MSGFEVAGLAIGIAGLMISTVEHFDKVTEPLKFYFEFSSRFEQLNDKVEVQRAIFQLQFRLLLSSVAEQEEVDEMMKSRLSPLWQSDELNSSLEGLYGDHYSAWRKSVGLVGEKLCKITEKLDIFAKDLSASESPSEANMKDKERKTSKKKRIRTCLSNSRLEQEINDIRSLNQDLKNLTSDILKVQTMKHAGELSQKTTAVEANRLLQFEFIQEASRELYEALYKACSHHPMHVARLGLQTAQSMCKDGEVDFTMEFCAAGTDCIIYEATSRHDGIRTAQASTNDEHVWITVRSNPTSARRKPPTSRKRANSGSEPPNPIIAAAHISSPAPHLDTLGNARSKAVGSARGDFQGDGHSKQATKKRKAVRFSGVEISVTTEVVSETTESVSLQTTTISSTQINGDFCVQIRQCRSSVVLGDPKTCCHTVSTNRKQKKKSQAINLGEIIQQTTRMPSYKRLSQLSRLRLARLLAEAVLQHHESNWIPEIWESSDVVFFIDPKKAAAASRNGYSNICESTPHIETRVVGNSSRRAYICPDTSPIRNTILCRLAIIMLELAYEAPLRSIEADDGLENPTSDAVCDPLEKDYLLAKKHLSNASRCLGLPYKKLVEKCLTCDFGSGQDLADAGLQRQFYSDIVVGLQEIEEGFRTQLRI